MQLHIDIHRILYFMQLRIDIRTHLLAAAAN
jgi:hypothetical protein